MEMKTGEAPPPQVLELRQTIEVLQEKLVEREGESLFICKNIAFLE